MTYTVVHAGTGITGREALRGLIDDPELVLAGVLVSSPDKAGRDAGALCGRPDTGVIAHDDFDAVLREKPDCFCYCSTAVGREEDAYNDIARLLRHGINVVTISTIPMVYPAAAPEKWQRLLESACAEGGSTFYASGCEPGIVSLNLPVALMAGAGQVDSYRMDEYAIDLDLVYPIWEVLHESMGFGKPDGHVPARIASGKVRHDWEAVVRYTADALGIALDTVDLDWETVLAPEDLTTALGPLPKGTICGHRWRLAGISRGEAVVAVQYFATVSSTPWPGSWPRPEGGAGMVHRIEGRPSMRLQMSFESGPGERAMPSLSFTGQAVVNAIPHVVDSAPGLLEPVLGRSVVTRQARRS
ncbi:dihydrodipicolinate reductase [Mycolicibacterium parafortuitum]|uniref:dihydrodipicolinate reductase n=1 Tax=Mycolicibacterium parafortuitum TaxID=39692 RepID=UPI001E40507F|nr:dihydrodipicolinate reductase [Mycolicibacterium parafortuitum]